MLSKQVPEVRACLFVEPEAGIGRKGRDIIGRHLDGQVSPTGEHLTDARVFVGDRAEDDAAQVERRSAPMVGVGFQRDLPVALPYLQLERTGAPAVASELLAVLFDRRRGNAGEPADRARQHGQHRRIGRREMNRHRVCVDHLGDVIGPSWKTKGNGPVSWKGWFLSVTRSKLNFTASASNRCRRGNGRPRAA